MPKKSTLSEKYANKLVKMLKAFVFEHADEISKLFKPELDKVA